jgi:hypothetical protein
MTGSGNGVDCSVFATLLELRHAALHPCGFAAML